MVLMDKGNIQNYIEKKDVALYESKGYVKYEPEKVTKKEEIPKKEEKTLKKEN